MCAPTGIEPTSQTIQADMLTTTPQRPGTNSVEFALSHSTMDYWWNRWSMGSAVHVTEHAHDALETSGVA